MDSTPTAKAIRKALEVYSSNEQEFTVVGWELYRILDSLTKARLERIIKEYLKSKEMFG